MFPIEDGVGNLFLRRLCTPCAGGKHVRQAKQIAKKPGGVSIHNITNGGSHKDKWWFY